MEEDCGVCVSMLVKLRFDFVVPRGERKDWAMRFVGWDQVGSLFAMPAIV